MRHPDNVLAAPPATPPTPPILHRHRAPEPEFVTSSTLINEAASAVSTPTRYRWTRPRCASRPRCPNLLVLCRAGSREFVSVRGRVPPVARVGTPAKLRACTGCVSSRRSMAKPCTGALARRASHDRAHFSTKDEAPSVHRSGPELDPQLLRQCALDAKIARPASSKTQGRIGLKLVVT